MSFRLKTVNLSKLNSVENMTHMFDGCTSLVTVNLPSSKNNNYKNCINFSYMFAGCISLVNVNITNDLTEEYSNND